MTGGRLYVVGTPLGNLEDLSARAGEALRRAGLIACEDTRRSSTLTRHVGAEGRLVSLHSHNEDTRTHAVLRALEHGTDVALITDAGMPTISDPGAHLIDAAITAGHVVESIPGPSAVTTALSLSGAPADRFFFAGFVPRKDGERDRWLDGADLAMATIVAFESPRRLSATLSWLARRDPMRPVAVCRELTKLHEEVVRGPAHEVANAFTEAPRGEITLILWPATPRDSEEDLPRTVGLLVGHGLGAGAAADVVAELGLGSRNAAYREAIAQLNRRET